MQRSIILFGAFDRHNFGDLLLPHIAAALLKGEELLFAGLASRDLRAQGGHAVQALAELAAERAAAWRQYPATLIHVGGEILTCSAWQAAVMLLPPEEVQPTIAYLEARPQERAAWVRRTVGSAALAPYTVSCTRLPGLALAQVLYTGVGGVGLGACEPALRAEVLANLQAADDVSVRDRQTLAQLTAAGIPARLLPDPAVMVAELFGAQIRQHAEQGYVARVLHALPQGYLGVQFSTDFGDDATLAQIASQLDHVAAATGLGVVLFRAGAAPWHDDLASLQRVAARMQAPAVQVFESLHLWDICALIAHSQAYCGSSLHGRIVAMAYARPRLNLRPPASADPPAKQATFAATWEEAKVPVTVGVDEIAEGIHQALALDRGQLQRTAERLVMQYHQGFETLVLTATPSTRSTVRKPASRPPSTE